MQVVGHLVGVGADERALDAVDRAVERVQRNGLELPEERLLQPRIEVFPEAAAPADEILPQARLALVHAGRCAVGERGALERAIDPQLVERVAALVQGREQRIGDLVLAHARGDADVPQ